ncbi:hypothetical protein JOD43_001579 [Pullulanibacillus pueri]|uniref:Uncharacterized protein n=1 Tax=Pullulanibacillus pueri TaxID=1437324 RepID=A0A8J2ZUG2_9BACL|nr:hypothetical protein [Pullulanibacillus pueri]MBM7681412.1 hypothetical protein [Pullulanibacillus pueri]GGH78774.1 hypothetical protein GCM10007096_12710 [Pullulanibacillus pueri]
MGDTINSISHHWILGIVAFLFILFIARAVIRMALKMAFIAAIIGVIMVVCIGLTPGQVIDKGKSAFMSSSDLYHETLEPLIKSEIDQADYSEKPNGDYTIKAEDLKIQGNPEKKEVIINFKGKMYTFSTDDISKKIKDKITSMNK